MTWPSPWSNQIISQLIVAGTGPGTGLFIYSGVPGFGNPPIFYASGSTVDPYGNPITPTAGLSGAGQFNAGFTIINPTGIFVYSGVPSASNLIGYWSGTGGTDPFGTVVGTGLGLTNASIPAQVAGQVLLFSDIHGLPRAVSGLSGDTDAYVLGHKFAKCGGSGTTVNSTVPITLGGMSFHVGPGTYHIRGRVRATNGSAGVLQPQAILFGGTLSISDLNIFVWTVAEQANTASPVMAVGIITTLNTGPSFDRTPALNENFDFVFDGYVNVSVKGTLLVQGSCVTSGADVSWLAQYDSYFMLWPFI